MKHLEGLNPAQQKAASLTEGPLLIVAGAGAGKTKTIVHRILGLIEGGVPPENILAVTFTNKAAAEMRERLARNLPSGKTLPLIKTFHALGLLILRENAAHAGLPAKFSILDEGDALSYIKEAIIEEGLDPKQFEPRRIKGSISKEKGLDLTVAEYEARAEGYFPELLAKLWARYEGKLAEGGAVDFDDLIARTVRLLKEKNEVLRNYQDRFRYIHIDEYQDTNVTQYELSRMLAGEARNICVVGDSDQNIYGWRGASLRNILSFERDYPNATVVLLEENYRSTKTIVEASNRIIEKNRIRVPKTLRTENAEGERITLVEAAGEHDEATFAAGRAAELVASGVHPDDIAVLYRANFQSRVLEDAFLREGVPYQVVGVRFFERREVKDLLAYLRAAENPKNLIEWRRSVNVPPRGIGKTTVAKVFAGKTGELPDGMRRKVAEFDRLLTDICELMKTMPVSSVLKWVIEKTGLENHLREDGEEGEERLMNIRELVSLAVEYDKMPAEEGMEKFLEDAALRSDQDELGEKKSGVKLMTVHAAKGLEFDTVFVTGLEQDLFPYARGESSDEDAEEERRLFYVAMTRAKRKLYLSFTALRTIFGSLQANTPSEFLSDIPPELVEFEEGTRGGREPSIYID